MVGGGKALKELQLVNQMVAGWKNVYLGFFYLKRAIKNKLGKLHRKAGKGRLTSA